MPNYNYDEERTLANLIRTIKRSNINASKKDELSNYVSNIKNGKANNDFFDIDTLETVILDLLDENKTTASLYDYINTIKFLLPYGKDSERYEEIKSLIKSGNIFIDKDLSFIFADSSNYVMFMRILKEKGLLEDKEKFNNIVDFAVNVKPLCINEDIFKGELLSYVNGLVKELDNLEEYKLKRIIEAKKRVGIYPIGEETLSSIAETCQKIMNLSNTFNDLEVKVKTYEETIARKTRSGVNKIDEEFASRIKTMQVDIDSAKEEAITELNLFVEDTKETLRKSANNVYSDILKESEESLRKIRTQLQSVQELSNNELLRITKAKDEVIESIKNNPELQVLLNSPLLKEQLKETIKTMSERKEISISGSETSKKVSEIVIPNEIETVSYRAVPQQDEGTIVIPYGPALKIPELGIDYDILPAFNEKIKFKDRFRIIMDKKHKREDNGEIFHPMIDEIIKDVMEGDLVQLYGPSGTGKTKICNQVASLIGLKVEDDIGLTDKSGVMAWNDPQGKFRITQAFKAALNGSLYLLDEVDLSTSEMLVVVGKLYSDFLEGLYNGYQEYVTFGENTNIPINPNFRMIVAGNTDGLGGDIAYSARRRIDESFLERVRPIFIDYDNRVEEKIFGKYKEWYKYFITFRAACTAYYLQEKHKKNTSIQGNATTRDARAIVRYIEHDSKTVDQIMREQFIQIKDDKYLSFIEDYFAKQYHLGNNITMKPYNESLESAKEIDLAKALVMRIRENKNNGK